ncbi:hypothetical protein BN6_52990 [Saccharothrix espanaensis DSM 44229]|uniref:Uncharacterized protein n=1 Tax=Saccharothrix espanaensis (strain ATCC 51144 / DSM 44229 / JCM 9112 / NBRC 15066 / NRRL 15764) TaxID=1179773 RepID=K0K7H3_SACES|nr:hypothetical protein BN6_52990 [Saccharothrix espanaensis DSM 44229]
MFCLDFCVVDRPTGPLRFSRGQKATPRGRRPPDPQRPSTEARLTRRRTMANDQILPTSDDVEITAVVELDDADLDTVAGGYGEFGSGRRIPRA